MDRVSARRDDMLILKAVSLGPLHGYGIIQRIRQMSGEMLDVEQGSLYPALYRIEQRGWVPLTGCRCRFSMSRLSRGAFCSTNITWNSGVWARLLSAAPLQRSPGGDRLPCCSCRLLLQEHYQSGKLTVQKPSLSSPPQPSPLGSGEEESPCSQSSVARTGYWWMTLMPARWRWSISRQRV